MILASRAASRVILGGGAAALAALALAISGCGGDTAANAGDTPVSSAEKPAAARPQGTAAKTAPVARRCSRQVGDFLDAMATLRERLVAGLSYEEYVGEIGVVRAVYDEVPVAKLTLACLAAAGTPGERAFGRYIAAANSWGECIDEEGCDAAAIEPVLQKQWRAASRHLDEAESGLDPS